MCGIRNWSSAIPLRTVRRASAVSWAYAGWTKTKHFCTYSKGRRTRMKRQGSTILGVRNLPRVLVIAGVVVATLILAGLLGIPSLVDAQGQVANFRGQKPTTTNGGTALRRTPLQIALLQWYDANLTTAFPVGAAPYGVAFDGANIWVANFYGTVTKLRANDGAPLGTFAVGAGPTSVAFDGANIWVTNQGSNNVTSCAQATALLSGPLRRGPTAGALRSMERTSGCRMKTAPR